VKELEGEAVRNQRLIIAGENPKGNKEIWESRERCRLLSLRN